jgi:phosphatidylinositol alpha-1,6-mannosyltransferase
VFKCAIIPKQANAFMAITKGTWLGAPSFAGVDNRILLVSELFPPAVGGSAALLGSIYGRLDVPVTVLTDPTVSGTDDPHPSVSARRWVRISGRLRGATSMAELAQIGSVARQIRQERRRARRTFVHTARPLPEGLTALASQMGSWGSAPYVTWVHGEDLAVALTSREHGWLATQVCRRASSVLCNSRFSAAIVGTLGVAAPRIRVVHPGVDADRFRPDVDGSVERAALGTAGPVLLSVGRLQRRKGHDTTIQAVAQVIQDFPGLRYVIAGDGAERPRLQKLAEELGVGSSVVFLGEVEDERLPALYAACDVFLMPTRREGPDVEGFGIVYLEAAASGRASIGGRNGGVPEAIEEGRSGLLVSGTDAEELAAAIRQLLASDTLRAEMGAAGRERVCQGFTWDHAARRVGEIHRELCESLVS